MPRVFVLVFGGLTAVGLLSFSHHIRGASPLFPIALLHELVMDIRQTHGQDSNVAHTPGFIIIALVALLVLTRLRRLRVRTTGRLGRRLRAGCLRLLRSRGPLI